MGLFSSAGPFDADVDKVTPEEDRGSEDWGSILDICDKVGKSSANAKDCLKSIYRRLNHANPHVVLKAITLLDACVKNCSKVFHLEVASREFEQEYRKLLKKAQNQPKIAESLKSVLKKWAENEFKSDPQLNIIPSLYSKLKAEGVEFPATLENMPRTTSYSVPKDPNAVTSLQEVDDIAQAIELSLKEAKLSGQSSLYPSTNIVNSNSGNRSYYPSSTPKPKHLVKALYDFEAAEDNELTFYTGEIIEVLDDSDKNWWKGVNRRGEGLFPANFVTDDLSTISKTEVENKNEHSTKSKNRVRFDDSVNVDASNNTSQENVIINEQKIDRLLHLLHEANPTEDSTDTEEMIRLEEEVNAMGPLIDAELEKVDRKHAQLTQLSSNLVDALNLYHTLMREPFLGSHQQLPDTPYGVPTSVHNLPHPHLMMYNSGANGPYSLPPGGRISEQYPPNTMHHNPMQPPVNAHQLNHPPSHHFVPISTVPAQSDGFHHPSMMNPPAPTHSYPQSLDPNLSSVRYDMRANLIPPQQMPQNLYQPIQHQVPLQEVSSNGNSSLQNNNHI